MKYFLSKQFYFRPCFSFAQSLPLAFCNATVRTKCNSYRIDVLSIAYYYYYYSTIFCSNSERICLSNINSNENFALAYKLSFVHFSIGIWFSRSYKTFPKQGKLFTRALYGFFFFFDDSIDVFINLVA